MAKAPRVLLDLRAWFLSLRLSGGDSLTTLSSLQTGFLALGSATCNSNLIHDSQHYATVPKSIYIEIETDHFLFLLFLYCYGLKALSDQYEKIKTNEP